MLLDEQFDADEILRDEEEKFNSESNRKDGAKKNDEEMEELEFGSQRGSSHYDELASEMDNAEDLWQ